ncbi:hypothetical protein AAFF_G00196510 [Aldrovandia affinis]|uniref:Uncharacterized protein n=1 Tax=Aldrovandia affinis TaxID=143900 RepID=A0AAD7RJ03_9TELE|nr:hypothetical protein AAFF_G00196510 [Aldrovandia affinis]
MCSRYGGGDYTEPKRVSWSPRAGRTEELLLEMQDEGTSTALESLVPLPYHPTTAETAVESCPTTPPHALQAEISKSHVRYIPPTQQQKALSSRQWALACAASGSGALRRSQARRARRGVARVSLSHADVSNRIASAHLRHLLNGPGGAPPPRPQGGGGEGQRERANAHFDIASQRAFLFLSKHLKMSTGQKAPETASSFLLQEKRSGRAAEGDVMSVTGLPLEEHERNEGRSTSTGLLSLLLPCLLTLVVWRSDLAEQDNRQPNARRTDWPAPAITAGTVHRGRSGPQRAPGQGSGGQEPAGVGRLTLLGFEPGPKSASLLTVGLVDVAQGAVLCGHADEDDGLYREGEEEYKRPERAHLCLIPHAPGKGGAVRALLIGTLHSRTETPANSAACESLTIGATRLAAPRPGRASPRLSASLDLNLFGAHALARLAFGPKVSQPAFQDKESSAG